MKNLGLEAPWPALVRFARDHDVASWWIDAPGRAPPDSEQVLGLGISPVRWQRAALLPSLRGEWIHAADPAWPRVLVGVPFGPVALSVEGTTALLHGAGVTIVGARACTARGRRHAHELAHAVRAAGGVVTSGLAWGIDAEAHLAAEGATIAVLGQGLATLMPPWQARLRAEILRAGGLVVSEFPDAQPPRPWTFPVRNRVLAALGRVIVVVEAGARSGARVTARLALGMGREVLAVPGSEGTDALIEEGAVPVATPDDVLRALRTAWRRDHATTALRVAGPGGFEPSVSGSAQHERQRA